MSTSRLLLLTLLFCMAACTTSVNRWDEPAADAPPPAAGDKRIVLFAPLAVGELAATYPEARLDLPHAMARTIDRVMSGYDGRVGETLPDSAAARWSEGQVAATAGAQVTVLTRVISLTRTPARLGVPPVPEQVLAEVDMLALDVEGKQLWHKRATAEADAATSPKFQAPASQAASLAVGDALDRALGGLRTFLDAQAELADQPQRASQQAPEITLIEVVFDPLPAHADLNIDGVFRGNTPLTLRLPPRPMQIRLHAVGCVDWEREVTPAEGMRIQPTLSPLAAAPPDASPTPTEPTAP